MPDRRALSGRSLGRFHEALWTLNVSCVHHSPKTSTCSWRFFIISSELSKTENQLSSDLKLVTSSLAQETVLQIVPNCAAIRESISPTY